MTEAHGEIEKVAMGEERAAVEPAE